MVKQKIAQYIEKKGIKQILIAQKTGISPQSISLLMRGKRNLDIDEYAKICEALEVPYDFFLDDKAG